MKLTGMIRKGQVGHLERPLQIMGNEGRMSIIVLELFAGPSVMPRHFSSLFLKNFKIFIIFYFIFYYIYLFKILNSSHFPASFFCCYSEHLLSFYPVLRTLTGVETVVSAPDIRTLSKYLYHNIMRLHAF